MHSQVVQGTKKGSYVDRFIKFIEKDEPGEYGKDEIRKSIEYKYKGKFNQDVIQKAFRYLCQWFANPDR